MEPLTAVVVQTKVSTAPLDKPLERLWNSTKLLSDSEMRSGARQRVPHQLVEVSDLGKWDQSLQA